MYKKVLSKISIVVICTVYMCYALYSVPEKPFPVNPRVSRSKVLKDIDTYLLHKNANFSIASKQRCSPHEKIQAYLHGWDYKRTCKVRLTTTLFVDSFLCLNIEVKTKKDDFDPHIVRVKSGIEKLTLKHETKDANSTYLLSYCRQHNSEQPYNLITIAWDNLENKTKQSNSIYLKSIETT